MYQILVGLTYCHSCRIFHRDLKPANILVDEERGTLKLADFGLARAFSVPIKTFTHEVVTLWYRAPEILLGKKEYSLGVDMWSVGCIFFELAHRKTMIMGDCEIDQIFRIFRLFGTPTEETWPGIGKLPDFKATFPKFKGTGMASRCTNFDAAALDLIERMMRLEPSQRISAKEALQHVSVRQVTKIL